MEYSEQLKKRARSFALGIMKLADALPVRRVAGQVIAHQIVRCATSVGANITEGQASPTRKDFTLFMTHALKSVNETDYWLSLIRDAELGDGAECDRLSRESAELCRILGATVRTLRK